MIKPIRINASEAICLPPGSHKLAALMQKRLHVCFDCNNPACKCKKQAAWAYVHEFNGNQHTKLI